LRIARERRPLNTIAGRELRRREPPISLKATALRAVTALLQPPEKPVDKSAALLWVT
jgi:hypothetical protein